MTIKKIALAAVTLAGLTLGLTAQAQEKYPGARNQEMDYLIHKIEGFTEARRACMVVSAFSSITLAIVAFSEDKPELLIGSIFVLLPAILLEDENLDL